MYMAHEKYILFIIKKSISLQCLYLSVLLFQTQWVVQLKLFGDSGQLTVHVLIGNCDESFNKERTFNLLLVFADRNGQSVVGFM